MTHAANRTVETAYVGGGSEGDASKLLSIEGNGSNARADGNQAAAYDCVALIVAWIVAIPAAAWAHHFRLAAILSGLVWIECGVLAVNHGRCPMTNLAERFTTEQSANFDIYLPEWLARRNKEIFGTLFVVNELIALVLWVRKS